MVSCRDKIATLGIPRLVRGGEKGAAMPEEGRLWESEAEGPHRDGQRESRPLGWNPQLSQKGAKCQECWIWYPSQAWHPGFRGRAVIVG